MTLLTLAVPTHPGVAEASVTSTTIRPRWTLPRGPERVGRRAIVLNRAPHRPFTLPGMSADDPRGILPKRGHVRARRPDTG